MPFAGLYYVFGMAAMPLLCNVFQSCLMFSHLFFEKLGKDTKMFIFYIPLNRTQLQRINGTNGKQRSERMAIFSGILKKFIVPVSDHRSGWEVDHFSWNDLRASC